MNIPKRIARLKALFDHSHNHVKQMNIFSCPDNDPILTMYYIQERINFLKKLQ